MYSTSATLLQRLRKADDRVAWDQFVELYTPLLLFWARKAGLQGADAEDLVQEVLMALLAKMPEFRYDPTHSFRSWLRTVTLNRWRNRRRSADRARLTLDQQVLDEQAVADPLVDFWETEYRQHLLRIAQDRIRPEFQPATWQAYLLTAVEGRPAPEVAEQLNLSVGAVYVARSRVLARLRELLEGLLD